MLSTDHHEADHHGRHELDEHTASFVTFTVAGQMFGIAVTSVQDILTPDVIASVPLGPKEVRGLINLRGRIVTVIDVRTRLSLPPLDDSEVHRGMGVTVENEGEFYTLLVDSVGDVVSLPAEQREPNPTTLEPLWQEIADGVFRTDKTLLVVLDAARLIAIRAKA
jgi:purine-binding chemotaxis protein CheW